MIHGPVCGGIDLRFAELLAREREQPRRDRAAARLVFLTAATGEDRDEYETAHADVFAPLDSSVNFAAL